MVGKSTTKVRGTRKPGRNRKGQNTRYINESRFAKSHIRRIKKHLKRYGDKDKVAVAELQRYQGFPSRGVH